MGHYPSSGVPYLPSGDLGPFGPEGEPKKLNDDGSASAEARSETDAALAEFAALTSKSKISALRAGGTDGHGQKIDIPTKPQVGNA